MISELMKKSALFLLIFLAACTSRFDAEYKPADEDRGLVPMTLVAEGTRTTLESDFSVCWNAGDSISVFDELGNHPFVTTASGPSVEFSGLASATVTARPILYPYDKYATADLGAGTIRTFIPGIQTGRVNSFGSVSNIAVAVAQKGAFVARNVCGLIKLTLDRSDLVSVDVISMDSSEKLSGWVSIGSVAATPAVDSLTSEGSHSVSLNAGGGNIAPGVYYLDAIPGTLGTGYCIRTTSSTGEVASKAFAGTKTIQRSGITDFGTVDDSWSAGYLAMELSFYDTELGKPAQPFTTDLPTSSAVTGETRDYSFSCGGELYTFSIRAESGFQLFNSASYKGLRLSFTNSTAWIKLPGISGKVLRKVTLLSGSTMTNYKEIRLVQDVSGSENSPLVIFNLKGGEDPSAISRNVPNAVSGHSYYLYLPSTANANAIIRNLSLEYVSDQSSAVPQAYYIRAKNQGETSWTLCRETHTVETIPGFCPTGEPELDEYGGWKGVFTFPATGWFYCAQRNGRWWMVDPLGNPFISKGLCGFRLDLAGQTAKNAFAAKYGSDYDRWAKGEWAMLKSYGFNSFGAFSNYARIKQHLRVPYTALISPWSAYLKSIKSSYIALYGEENWTSDGPFGFPMVFDTGFANAVETAASALSAYSADPYMMGVMSDNEWPVSNDFLSICLNWPDKTHINYTKAVAWLEENEVTAAVALESLDWKRKFAAFCYDSYLLLVSTAVKNYAPHHMYMGSKLTGNNHGLANDYAFQAAAGYVDAMSIDWYHIWTPSDTRLRQMADLCHAPIILAEWYVKGEDTDPQDGLTNATGVGYTVPTQTDRGRYYQNYVIGGLRSGAVVGWHWFRYMDNDPDSAPEDNPSNVNANKGVVTRRLTPYPAILNQMKMVNDQVYPLCQFYN